MTIKALVELSQNIQVTGQLWLMVILCVAPNVIAFVYGFPKNRTRLKGNGKCKPS